MVAIQRYIGNFYLVLEKHVSPQTGLFGRLIGLVRSHLLKGHQPAESLTFQFR